MTDFDPDGRDEIIPFSRIRKRTAAHMVRSKATSPHALVVTEVDYEHVDTVRRASAEAPKARKSIALSYLAFVARATIDAIRAFPQVNASVGEDELVVHEAINLGVAVDLDFEGLIVPVIHQADRQTTQELSRAIADLAQRARTKRLSADDVVGGTFTISNLGPYGTLLTSPVINQPQVAILAVDGVKEKPVVVKGPDGTKSIDIHPIGNLALAWDHRAFDGAYAASFLGRIKGGLESDEWKQRL
jgi:pyruvate dehydrogenase E2 component (dihydrolipoamide acetyltransferase)